VRPYSSSRCLEAVLICVGTAVGSATVAAQDAQGQAPAAPGVIQQPTPPSRTPPAELRPRPWCAAVPECRQGSAAFCIKRGVCMRGPAGRPERTCLAYACIARLQSGPSPVIRKPPLAAVSKFQSGGVR
jgi:hypothetical protein